MNGPASGLPSKEGMNFPKPYRLEYNSTGLDAF